MQCNMSKHNFTLTDVYTGGVIYKCDKCGLEVDVPNFSGEVFAKYFGSYFNRISHVWDVENMSANDIIGFDVTFGDSPAVTVRYYGNKFTIQISPNSIRDTSAFDEKEFILSEAEKLKLQQCLISLDFNSFLTTKELFNDFQNMDFHIGDRLICYFSNGKGFECLSPSTGDFETLVATVKEIIDAHITPVQQEITNRTTFPGFQVACCNKAIPEFYSYCPYCGKPIVDKATKSDVSDDSEETIWFCAECGSDNSFEYNFCCNCGLKCPWKK